MFFPVPRQKEVAILQVTDNVLVPAEPVSILTANVHIHLEKILTNEREVNRSGTLLK